MSITNPDSIRSIYREREPGVYVRRELEIKERQDLKTMATKVTIGGRAKGVNYEVISHGTLVLV